VASSPELGQKPGAVQALLRSGADLDPAPGLLDEEEADLDAVEAHGVVREVLGSAGRDPVYFAERSKSDRMTGKGGADPAESPGSIMS
jgi:hypothetical protein